MQQLGDSDSSVRAALSAPPTSKAVCCGEKGRRLEVSSSSIMETLLEQAVIRQSVWTSLTTASEHPSKARLNRHIWLVILQWKERPELKSSPIFSFGVVQNCCCSHLNGWSERIEVSWPATEMTIRIRMATSGYRVNAHTVSGCCFLGHHWRWGLSDH